MSNLLLHTHNCFTECEYFFLYTQSTENTPHRPIYRIFWPIVHALSIQKRSEIVKNEHARYTLEIFPTNANGHKKSQGTVLQFTTDH
jgi:hypothetical protein